jgi:branched-chain amino acid transport system substrate-binding protein
MRSPRWLWGATAVALALAPAACGRSDSGSGGSGSAQSDPGITKTTIKLGGSYPFSGPASAYGTIGAGAKAYFAYLNAKGGVNGRKIDFIALDDGYEPPRALQNARRLVQQDKVFAMFNTLGTPNNLAIWDFLNQQKVPQLYVATGASNWGKDIKGHPYTIGWQPNYVTEGKVYANYLKTAKPSAKVAILYQNDAYGKDLLGGFEQGISGTGVKVVAKVTYNVTDPTVAPQVGRLARSGADTFLSITTPKPAAQAIATVAKSGWKPLQILNNVGADKNLVLKPVGLQNAKGAISTAYFKDPQTAQWANDPAVKEYRDALKKYSPKSDPEDAFNMYGWTVATTMAKALEQMKKPTRAALMDAVRNMDLEQGTLLPGEKVQTSPTDGYPLEAMQIIKFDGQNWQLQGHLIQAKAN